MNAGALRSPQDRAQVARVFDTIKHDDQRLGACANPRSDGFKQLVRVGIPRRGHARQDSLMISTAGGAIQGGARRATDGNILSPRQIDQLPQAILMRALGHHDLFDLPIATQSLEHRIDAIERLAI